jgi:uncharacterized membrane protein
MHVLAKDFFSREEQDRIRKAIYDAEQETSGEIRIHIENSCMVHVLDRAAFIFRKLKMHKTVLRNGVLIYLAIHDRKFAIIGDTGINQAVPEDFWDNIKKGMQDFFRQEAFAEGLCYAIKASGEQLKKYFPHKPGDVNELADDISFGKR